MKKYLVRIHTSPWSQQEFESYEDAAHFLQGAQNGALTTFDIVSTPSPNNPHSTSSVAIDRKEMRDGRWITELFPVEFEGTLYGHFETGSEGVHWAILSDKPYKDLCYNEFYFLHDGDELIVYNDDRSVRWRGAIDFDREIGMRPFAWYEDPVRRAEMLQLCGWVDDPKQYSQQCALGMWVHGIQRGFEPDEWATLFFVEPALRVKGIRCVRR